MEFFIRKIKIKILFMESSNLIINHLDGENGKLFISPGVYVRDSNTTYTNYEYVSQLETELKYLMGQVALLKERINLLENPAISKVRKDKIEQIFTED